MIEVKAYQCEHCNRSGKRKVYAVKNSCRGHEKRCFQNPENRACATCALWVDECGLHRTRRPKFCQDDHPSENLLQNHCHHWVPMPDEVEE